MGKKLCLAAASFVCSLVALDAVASAAQVVNISGMSNGEAVGSSCCNGPLISPVQVVLAAGTYEIGDAWDPITGFATGALYKAWNYNTAQNTSWAWHWKVLYDDGAAGATINAGNYASYILADVDDTQSFSTEQEAAVFGAGTPHTVFTLSDRTTLDFVVNDYYLPDNAGGVSLLINEKTVVSNVPLPASAPLFGAALMALGAVGFGIKRKAAAAA